jgi:hypothetical protein
MDLQAGCPRAGLGHVGSVSMGDSADEMAPRELFTIFSGLCVWGGYNEHKRASLAWQRRILDEIPRISLKDA